VILQCAWIDQRRHVSSGNVTAACIDALRRADADVRRDADRSGLAGCSGLVLDRRVDAFGLRCCFLRCQRHPPEPQHVPQSSVTAHELKSAERHGAGSRRSRGGRPASRRTNRAPPDRDRSGVEVREHL